MKIVSWNVNGIRAIAGKGFADTVASMDADIIGIQETKAQPDQLIKSAQARSGIPSGAQVIVKLNAGVANPVVKINNQSVTPITVGGEQVYRWVDTEWVTSPVLAPISVSVTAGGKTEAITIESLSD